jgi:hypothetical protein
MIDFIKRLFDKIRWIFLGIIVVAVALFSLYLSIACAAELILKLFSII